MRKNDRKISQARKSSQDLFLEAKRRFHYKPQAKRSDVLKHPNQTHSSSCSLVDDNNKEQSNDFSWLEKMVGGFDYLAKQNKKKPQQKQTVQRLVGLSKPRVALAERKLNRSNSSSRPTIKRCLEKSLERSKGKLHKAVVTKKHQIIDPEAKESYMQLAPEPEQCPKLFPSIKCETPAQNQLGVLMNNLQTEPECQDKLPTTTLPPQPTPQSPPELFEVKRLKIHLMSEGQKPQEAQTCRVLGRIKKNVVRPHQQNTSLEKAVAQSGPEVQRGASRLGALSLCQEPIQEQEEERSDTNKLEQKFREIFERLDTGRLGYISRSNCYSGNMHDDIRYLVGPILSKVKYQERQFTLKAFVEEGKRILSALEAHEVNKLLKCSITSRIFDLETKRSEYDRRPCSALERQSCSAIIRHYREFERGEGDGGRKEASVDRSIPLCNSVSEDWRKEEEEEPMGKARARHVRKPEAPRLLGLHKREFSILQTPENSVTIQRYSSTQKKHELRELLSPGHLAEAPPAHLQISELERSFEADRCSSKYLMSKEDEYKRIDFLNEKLSKYIQENQLRLTRSSSICLELQK